MLGAKAFVQGTDPYPDRLRRLVPGRGANSSLPSGPSLQLSGHREKGIHTGRKTSTADMDCTFPWINCHRSSYPERRCGYRLRCGSDDLSGKQGSKPLRDRKLHGTEADLMSVKVKVTVYPGAIKRLESAKKKAFDATVEAVLADIKASGVVPKDTGALEDSGFTIIEDMVAYIIFDIPYARRLYWHPEFNFRTDKNVNAQGLWMQAYIDGEKNSFVKDTYGKFLKQFGGGLIK